jgi:hypothetical protein
LSQPGYIARLPELKKKNLAAHWWFRPIILATQEAEMRKITVQSFRGRGSRSK